MSTKQLKFKKATSFDGLFKKLSGQVNGIKIIGHLTLPMILERFFAAPLLCSV